MNSQTIERYIEYIVNASNGALTFANLREGDMEKNLPRPLVMCVVETSTVGIVDEGRGSEKPMRSYNVQMLIVNKVPEKGYIEVSGKKHLESESGRQLRMNDVREKYKNIIEQIHYILTSEKYPFRVHSSGDIDFDNIREDDTTLNEYGVQASFTVMTRKKRIDCCIDFDESVLTSFANV